MITLSNSIQFLLRSALTTLVPAGRCPRKLKRQHRHSRTEQLEVRQLLTGDFEWAKRMGGTSFEEGNAIAVDAAGNVYTTGDFYSTADFDPGAGAFNLTSAGASDIFVSKLDRAGNFVWAKRMGGTAIDKDEGNAIAVDAAGNVYTTGDFYSAVDFDPGAGVFNLTSAGQSDIFVSKLDSSGNFVWAKRMGGTSSDFGDAIAIDDAGNVYTTGSFRGTVDFDPGAVWFNLTSAGIRNIFVSKLDDSGNFVWAKRMGGTDYDKGNAIAVDAAGNVYTTGNFYSTADFDPGAGAFNLTSAGASDIFVSKLDRAGNFVWAKRMGGTAIDKDEGNAIAVDAAGNVYTTGDFYSAVDFDPGAGVFNLTSAGQSDIFVSKLDSSGNFVWAKRMGGTSSDFGDAIAIDDAGNVYTTGSFRGTVDFDPGAVWFNLTSAGIRNIFVSKLDDSGNFVWAKRMGGTDYDKGNAIAVDAAGNVYTTGNFYSTADFDPGAGAFNLTSAGNWDIFVSKLSPDMLFTLASGLTGDVRLRRNGEWLELSFNGTFTSGEYVLQDRHRLSTIHAVRITDNSNSNTLTLDYGSGGGFSVDGGIHHAARGGAADSLRLIGVGNEGFTYAASSLTLGSGKILTYGDEVLFTDVESVFVKDTQHLLIEPQGSADVLTAAPGTGFQGHIGMTVSGTSGGAAFAPITLDNVRDLTIDTGLKDGLLAQSNDTVSFAVGSLEGQGLQNVFVRTGKGSDILTVNGPDIGLPVSDSKFWFLGGSGVDRLTAIGDTNWDLNDIRLVSAGGGKILHDDIEKASITGGTSKNHLNASLFSGDVTLAGGSNNDLLRGGTGDDTLFGGIGNDRIFGGLGDDIAYGQDGNDELWGDAGEDTLLGNAGNDQIWGGDDNDILSGDAGDDVVQGGAGDDIVNGGDNNDRLFGGDGNDTINGDAGDDFVQGGTGNDTLIGGAGIDLYDLQGTNNAEDLNLQRASATSSSFRRKPRGLVSVLELDSITMDATDEFLISALGGDDLIAIDLAFTQLGSVDGGDGTDSCTAPAAWTKVSC